MPRAAFDSVQQSSIICTTCFDIKELGILSMHCIYVAFLAILTLNSYLLVSVTEKNNDLGEVRT
jgi:hypothetical protein